jgi:hypothetical protein
MKDKLFSMVMVSLLSLECFGAATANVDKLDPSAVDSLGLPDEPFSKTTSLKRVPVINDAREPMWFFNGADADYYFEMAYESNKNNVKKQYEPRKITIQKRTLDNREKFPVVAAKVVSIHFLTDVLPQFRKEVDFLSKKFPGLIVDQMALKIELDSIHEFQFGDYAAGFKLNKLERMVAPKSDEE